HDALTRTLLALLLAALMVGCSGGAAGARPAPSPSSIPSTSPLPTPTPMPAPVPQRAEASLPEARQEVASTSTDLSLVVIGGFDAARRDSSSVFVYTAGWSRGPAFPVAVDHAAAATL